MAYFSNGSEGMCLDDQCAKCKYGKSHCPIAFAQLNWNYEVCNDPVAREILDFFVEQNGTCAMWVEFRKDLEIDPNQEELQLPEAK